MLYRQHVIQTTCYIDDMLYIRHVIQTTCYIDDMLYRRHVIQTTCYIDDMLYRRHVIQTTCYIDDMLYRRHVIQTTCYLNHLLYRTPFIKSTYIQRPLHNGRRLMSKRPMCQPGYKDLLPKQSWCIMFPQFCLFIGLVAVSEKQVQKIMSRIGSEWCIGQRT